MANATDLQIQNWADQRSRVRAEAIRALREAVAGDIAQIDDVYASLNGQSPTWTDNRTDGPPHLLTPGDVLGIHAFNVALLAMIDGHGQYPVVLKACVRPVNL